MQLSLKLSNAPAPMEATWAALSVEERLAAVAALARVMAKSINNEDEEEDDE